MPPASVKPYVKRQKNDATDAEAICEAVTRPNMRFVPTDGWCCTRAVRLYVSPRPVRICLHKCTPQFPIALLRALKELFKDLGAKVAA